MKMALANLTLVLVALGLIAFVVSIVLAIMKKIKWRYPPIILVVTLVVLVVAVEAIGPIDESKSADVRVGKLVYSKGDKEDSTVYYDTNGNGQATIKVKGLADGQVVVQNDDDEHDFKDQIVKVKKGKTTKTTIKQPEKQDDHYYVLDEGNGHKERFCVLGGNENLSADVGSTINDDLADRLSEEKDDGSSWARYVTKVTYKDKHITVHLNSNVYALNRKALDNLARMSQGMALAVLDEDDEISDSKASEGMSTQWKVGDDIVGYTGLGNYHNYKWNI